MASNDSGKIDLIYDLLKTDRQEASTFRKDMIENQQDTNNKLTQLQIDAASTEEKLVKIEKLDEIQNAQLAEHMRRTFILEQLHSDNQTRIEKLEEPHIMFSTGKKWIITIGAIAGAIAGILKLFRVY